MQIVYDQQINLRYSGSLICQFLLLLSFYLFTFTVIDGQELNPEKTVTIEEIPAGEIFSYGKTVVIKKGAKGVLVFGGDIVVEGRVEEDVATIGGSVYQRQGAFIGGDIIIFGGSYQHESPEPLRNPGKETIMIAGYKEELREFTLNPGHIFAPQFSVSFFVQRVIAALFWFIISIVLITIAPGAISRAVALFKLSATKVVAIGALAFWVVTFAALASVSFLPVYLNVIIVPMAFLAIILPLFYGRAALQVSVGKWLQRQLFSAKFNSESLAILLGTLFWTILLSIPYLWVLVVFFLFASGLGLVLTVRSGQKWGEPGLNL